MSRFYYNGGLSRLQLRVCSSSCTVSHITAKREKHRMETIVLYPSPGIGHIVSMVELAKSIHRTVGTTNITILVSVPSYDTGATAAYISRASAADPFINFHQLPQVQVDRAKCPSGEAALFQVLSGSKPHVCDFLQSPKLSGDCKISAFIIDFFCSSSLPIAKELGIPTYYFFTSAAACLALFLYVPTLDDVITENFKDMGDELVEIPGIPPIPASQMVKPLLVRDSPDYKGFMEIALTMPKSEGIIVNTFEALEARALKALRDGICNPKGRTPPIFCVGPVMQENPSGYDSHECIKWLDAQPSKSVVFLCFGSLGLHSARQLREMAVGLERSGLRFLWAVRTPATVAGGGQSDLESLLPQGFLGRTEDRGLVVTSWVPQVGVLNHGSVGGFVSHCGWNSVLEAVWAGVPMVAWPLYAEQHFNRVVLVEELGLALRFEEIEDGFVSSDELEKTVRELMESENGRRVRKRATEMSAEARAALADGGTSYIALYELVQVWKHK